MFSTPWLKTGIAVPPRIRGDPLTLAAGCGRPGFSLLAAYCSRGSRLHATVRGTSKFGAIKRRTRSDSHPLKHRRLKPVEHIRHPLKHRQIKPVDHIRHPLKHRLRVTTLTPSRGSTDGRRWPPAARPAYTDPSRGSTDGKRARRAFFSEIVTSENCKISQKMQN